MLGVTSSRSAAGILVRVAVGGGGGGLAGRLPLVEEVP